MIIAWFSCGVTSAVACKIALSLYEDVQLYYIETGSGHPDNSTHFKNLPAGVVQILWGAFCPEAMTGGAAGMMLAVENGIANSGRMAMRYGAEDVYK